MQIRQLTLDQMKSLDYETKLSTDQILANRLFNSNLYHDARNIGIVLSMPHEIDTKPIIQQMLNSSKRVFVPETNYETKKMDFKLLPNLDGLGTDEKGIPCVIEDTLICNELDLLIVPGVAFNKEGYRIGYGGGFFDRFISQYKPKTISLVYDFQLKSFNHETHDQPVDSMIIAST
ncbi:5-formyltetrahydrofolate cyclo-ligase [Staphylococcus marylandisciuri]|nr:5-formyltetrahydrofolate cyclo-ligase [Staphylococcus marylandisciuri]